MKNLKRFVNTPEFNDAFLEMILGRITQVQRILEQAVKIEEVYRAQGQITALRRLLNLRDEVNSLDK